MISPYLLRLARERLERDAERGYRAGPITAEEVRREAEDRDFEEWNDRQEAPEPNEN